MANVATLDGPRLLEKHNPVLVLFPHEPVMRSRPGALRPGPPGWGDYHPCSVEFFLERAHLRQERPKFDPLRWFKPSTWSWHALERHRYDTVRAAIESSEPAETQAWEFDVAELPSQNEAVAWATYRSLLQETDSHPYRGVVYARLVPGPPTILQYWYLYLYNDFRNNHEADWELVAIELSEDGTPQRVGLSGHHRGYQRPWAAVEKEGEHKPLVHVAIGSHAGYFAYRCDGYPVITLSFRSNLPFPLGVLQLIGRGALWLLHRLPLVRSWRDLPPADGAPPDRKHPEHAGERVRPTLELLDDPTNAWMQRYRGKWGSTRPRFVGATGIDSPWAGGAKDKRWNNPEGWLGDLREDKSARSAGKDARDGA